jgi:catechol 2,3-dioxygenase-like lactoylglutathione lyase family enzyme
MHYTHGLLAAAAMLAAGLLHAAEPSPPGAAPPPAVESTPHRTGPAPADPVANRDRTRRLNVTGVVHININVSNFDRSRAFYEALGFRLAWMVPPTNTPEVAAAVGMPPYRVRGGLMVLEGAEHPVVIDLLEWQSPHDGSPPYPHLYHYGLARLALSTSDLDADLATLAAMGVELVGPPARVVVDGVPSGGRFVCFKDPDGTVLELVERGSASSTRLRRFTTPSPPAGR